MSDPATMDPATILYFMAQLDHAIFQVQTYFAALSQVAPDLPQARSMSILLTYCGFCNTSCIVFYEWIVNFKREIDLIWRAKWTLVKALYLFIRYTGIAHAIIDLYAYFGFWRADVCKQFFVFIPAFPIFGVTASHIILLIQCHAVWNREGLVLIALIPLMVSETVIMAVIAFTQNEPIPLFEATGPCLPRATSAICVAYFIMPMAFDLAVTILTAIKCIKLRNADRGISVGSSLLDTIIQQSFQYFIFITAANLVNVMYYAIHFSDPTSALNGPLAIIATEIFACRLALELRDVKHKESHSHFIGQEVSRRNFVKVVVFGNEQYDDGNELDTIKARPHSQGAI